MASIPQTVTVTDHAPFIELRGPLFDVGIFRDTLLPTFGVNSTLAIIAYGAGRYTDKLDAKDWLWPSGQVINAWWTCIGRKVVYRGATIGGAISSLSRPERLLLTGVTLWGGRLFYRVASRTIRRGRDDPKYDVVKKEENFWNTALLSKFLPAAVFQTLIALPFTVTYRHQGARFTGYHPGIQTFAVGLFCAGLTLEVLADYQLDDAKAKGQGQNEMFQEGVWSIVRHPNYLGDALLHLSFPIMLFASDMLAPVELLAPIANYVYLRYVGGDKENEESQAQRYVGAKRASFAAYRDDVTKNSFWPDPAQLQNKWTWIVLGAGAVGAFLEGLTHVVE